VENQIITSLFTDVFNHALAQETYDASLAGLGFDFACTSAGIHLNVNGYSDRLDDFATKLLNLVMNPHALVEDNIVDALRERKLRKVRLRASACMGAERAQLMGAERAQGRQTVPSSILFCERAQ
jgi:secreted Zn-dependent insulinase-like peptidase